MKRFKAFLQEKVDLPEFNSSPSQAELNAMGVKSEATQIETTIAAKIKPHLTPEELKDGLEYGAGLCHGAKALGIESFEPYPDAVKKVNPTYTNISQIKKKYKFILCSYVLNVVGYDQREIIIGNIGKLLKPGGRAVIIVRGAEDVKSIKQRLVTYGDYEFLTKKGKDLTYQKGFLQSELQDLCQEVLGSEYKVMKFDGSNSKSVRVQIVKEHEAINENTNGGNYKCRSLSNAKDILTDNGIEYDNIYKMIYMRTNSYGITSRDLAASLHYYFNKGKDTNVAVFTPSQDSLVINIRQDGTPEDKKEYIK